MKSFTIAAAAAFAIAACGAPNSDTSTTLPDAEQARPADAVEVTIISTEVGSGEVTIEGEKPTPCHELGSIIDPVGDTIEIEVWAEPGDADTCAQVIDPFEISFEFETPDDQTPIVVNGEEVGRDGG